MSIKKIITCALLIILLLTITFKDRLLFLSNISFSILSIDENMATIVNNFYKNPSDEMTYKDIVFKERGTMDLKLDIYESKVEIEGGSPVLIYVFGNAWMYGNKNLPDEISPLINTLQEEGFTVISTSYELLKDEPIFDTQVSDIKDTIRWIYKNENEYNFNTDSIGILSLSAGAHLSMLASFSENDEFIGDSDLSNYPSEVSYIVNLFGPSILSDINFSLASEEVFNTLNNFDINKLSDEYSPLNYIKEDLPNMLIIHSMADTIVPFSNSLELYSKGLEYNNDFEFLELENASHYLDNLSDGEMIKFYSTILNYIYTQSIRLTKK